MFRNFRVTFAFTFALIGAIMLYGCGGGGGASTSTSSTGGTISGTVVKGPVSGATAIAYSITNGTMGSAIASAMTDTAGNFTMTVGDYGGPVMLLMSGGTYTDEATGATMTMHGGDVMTSVISSMMSGATMTGIHVTPLTSMAQVRAEHMTGGMTDSNINSANDAVGNYFMVSDILHTTPMNPLEPGSGAVATTDMRNYGMAIAAMSQEAKDLGMTSSSGMVTAMMDDASDGLMNGMTGTTQISMTGMGGMMGGGTMMQSTAGTSGLATAMTEFMNNLSVNLSGLTTSDLSSLMSKMTGSSGAL